MATSAPTRELGAQAQPAHTGNGWSAFIDEAEYVPELSWPQSVSTAHRMRSDSQVDALHIGTTLAIRDFRWSIDPNGAPAKLVEDVATDFGLPIRGHEDEDVPLDTYGADFDEFLTDALLAPLYGHFYFEIVGRIEGDVWRFSKPAPRHPRTIADFRTATNGDLLAIRQNIGGASGPLRMPPELPFERLIPFVWRREAGSWVGRSMLRSLYREWLVKDRTIRVAAINVERAGGMPVVEGPQGASDGQLRELAALARQFKVAEGGGGAIPFGSKLHLVGGNTPDAISLLHYCDEAMARVWALMLVQLGQTETGSRALGGEFSSYAARAQRAMAGWVRKTVDVYVMARYARWRIADARYAPRLHFESGKPDALSTEELVSLLTAGALTVDPELEAWIRDERGVPPKPAAAIEPPAPPEPPAPTDPVAPTAAPGAPSPATALVAPGSSAAGRPRIPREVRASLPLPDRELRRQVYDVEVQAQVDFRELDAAHAAVLADVEVLFLGRIIPAQVAALQADVMTTKAGTPRQRLTRAAMAALQAPALGRDETAAALLAGARSGATLALSELASQGLVLDPPTEEALAGLVADQADAVVAMAANGISLSAQRKATGLVGGGRTPAELAAELGTYLGGLKHSWTTDQVRGAVTAAQNAGRFHVFAKIPTSTAARFHASEILDTATCSPCIAKDGTEYDSIEGVLRDYPTGGYVLCDGGPRCRGTAVAVLHEQNPLSSSNPVLTAASGFDESLHPRGRGGKFAVKPGDDEDAFAAALAGAEAAGLNDWPTKGKAAQAILGDAPDTQALHSTRSGGVRRYSAARRPLHDAIVGRALADGVSPLLGEQHPITVKLRAGEALDLAERTEIREAAAADRDGSPRALFMAGGPASGKTSALRASPESIPPAAVTVDPDAFKAQLPEYQGMRAAGDRYAASGAHEESSDIAKRLVAETQDLGLNVVVDGTGDSAPGKFVAKIRAMMAAGYDVSALYVSVDTPEAVRRAIMRAMKSGRWVPVPEIETQHRNVSGNFPDVVAIEGLQDLKLFDNNGAAPVLVAHLDGGALVVDDAGAFEAFTAKAGAPPAAAA